MIVSFRDRETERVWRGERSLRLPPWIQATALRKLRLLNRALVLTDLSFPRGNRLEALAGNRLGQFSMRINDQWRVCFRWTERGAEDVEIIDYHA
jgi:proteic killer suppression protein